MGDLTKNLSRHEFKCPESGFDNIDLNVVHLIQMGRNNFGKAIITSGCRSVEYNEKVGGAENSYHITAILTSGKAVDVTFQNGEPVDWYSFYDSNFIYIGLGMYNYHIHIDVRGSKARWDERN